jgi:hypothetical protein
MLERASGRDVLIVFGVLSLLVACGGNGGPGGAGGACSGNGNDCRAGNGGPGGNSETKTEVSPVVSANVPVGEPK